MHVKEIQWKLAHCWEKSFGSSDLRMGMMISNDDDFAIHRFSQSERVVCWVVLCISSIPIVSSIRAIIPFPVFLFIIVIIIIIIHHPSHLSPCTCTHRQQPTGMAFIPHHHSSLLQVGGGGIKGGGGGVFQYRSSASSTISMHQFLVPHHLPLSSGTSYKWSAMSCDCIVAPSSLGATNWRKPAAHITSETDLFFIKLYTAIPPTNTRRSSNLQLWSSKKPSVSADGKAQKSSFYKRPSKAIEMVGR